MKRILIILLYLISFVGFGQTTLKYKKITATDSIQSPLYLQKTDTLSTKSYARSLIDTTNILATKHDLSSMDTSLFTRFVTGGGINKISSILSIMSPGETLIVDGGDYSETSTLQADGKTIYFMGSNVTWEPATNINMIDMSLYSVGLKIYGNGNFTASNSNGGYGAFIYDNSGNGSSLDVHINCSMTNIYTYCINLSPTAGCKFSSLYINGYFNSTATTAVIVDNYYGTSASNLSIDGIFSSTAREALILNKMIGNVKINGMYINTSSSYYCIKIDNSQNGLLLNMNTIANGSYKSLSIKDVNEGFVNVKGNYNGDVLISGSNGGQYNNRGFLLDGNFSNGLISFPDQTYDNYNSAPRYILNGTMTYSQLSLGNYCTVQVNANIGKGIYAYGTKFSLVSSMGTSAILILNGLISQGNSTYNISFTSGTVIVNSQNNFFINSDHASPCFSVTNATLIVNNSQRNLAKNDNALILLNGGATLVIKDGVTIKHDGNGSLCHAIKSIGTNTIIGGGFTTICANSSAYGIYNSSGTLSWQNKNNSYGNTSDNGTITPLITSGGARIIDSNLTY